MTPATRHVCAHKLVAAPFAFLLGLAGLAACGDEEADAKEFGDVDKVGEKVTVRAEVSEVISDHSFAVTGTEITSLDEILVVSAADVDVREEHEVEVTGILREDFDAVRVGEELGLFWEERPYQAWNGEHYIQATRVEE